MEVVKMVLKTRKKFWARFGGDENGAEEHKKIGAGYGGD